MISANPKNILAALLKGVSPWIVIKAIYINWKWNRSGITDDQILAQLYKMDEEENGKTTITL